MMRIEEEDSLELVLREEAVPEADDRWQTLEIRAPKEVPVRNIVATKEQKERNAARMAEAERLRKARFAACFDEKKAAAYPEAEEIFHRAGENFWGNLCIPFQKMKIRTGRSCCFRWL